MTAKIDSASPSTSTRSALGQSAGSALPRRQAKETRKHWQVRAYNAATLQWCDHEDVKWKMFEAGWQAAMNSKPLKQNKQITHQ
jgi:hypothetical protein